MARCTDLRRALGGAALCMLVVYALALRGEWGLARRVIEPPLQYDRAWFAYLASVPRTQSPPLLALFDADAVGTVCDISTSPGAITTTLGPYTVMAPGDVNKINWTAIEAGYTRSAMEFVMNDATLDAEPRFGARVARDDVQQRRVSWERDRALHPCCAQSGYFPTDPSARLRTFAALRYGVADYFRTAGNGSRLVVIGDSVSRLSAIGAMCDLVAAGATMLALRSGNDRVEALRRNITRRTGVAVPTFCQEGGDSFLGRGWWTTVEWRLPSATGRVGRPTMHAVKLEAQLGSAYFPPYADAVRRFTARDAVLINAGVWYNVGGAVNEHLRYENDPPRYLHAALLASFAAIGAALAATPRAQRPLVFWRESTPQGWPSVPRWATPRMEVAKGCDPRWPETARGGEFPGSTPCCAFDGNYVRIVCQRDGEDPDWSRAVPYRWRQRVAMHAACAAGLDVATPPFESAALAQPSVERHSAACASVRARSCDAVQAKRAVHGSQGGLIQHPALRLRWLPFYDATLQMRDTYAATVDCTHPGLTQGLWRVVWDGMTRHALARESEVADPRFASLFESLRAFAWARTPATPAPLHAGFCAGHTDSKLCPADWPVLVPAHDITADTCRKTADQVWGYECPLDCDKGQPGYCRTAPI